MKVQEKLYNRITSEPFDVQKLNNDVTIELHSLNENVEIYDENIGAGKFAIWTSADGTNYRLLIEDGYYARLKELYGKRVNQVWVDFWDRVSAARKKLIRRVFIPISIIIFIAIMVATILMGDSKYGFVILLVLLGVFLITNIFINRKVDKMIRECNNEASEKIKNIVGHKHFDELMDISQQYSQEFFSYTPEEEETAEEAPAEEESGCKDGVCSLGPVEEEHSGCKDGVCSLGPVEEESGCKDGVCSLEPVEEEHSGCKDGVCSLERAEEENHDGCKDGVCSINNVSTTAKPIISHEVKNLVNDDEESK